MDEIKKCKKKDCLNDAISFSDFCGLHISKRKIESVLEKLELGGNFDNIKLSRIAPKDASFNDLNVNDIQIMDVLFTSFKIINSNFGGLSNFSKTNFDEVLIQNCNFSGVMFEDTDFTGVNFINCNFSDCNFNQCHFTFEGSISNTSFNQCKFSGCTIDDNIIENSSFRLVEFLICTIEKCNIRASSFIDVEFATTNIYDNEFKSVNFERIEHDFDLSSYIRLCIFEECNFIDFKFPDDFEKLNTTNEQPMPFYKRVVEQFTNKPDINFLNVVNSALFRIGNYNEDDLLQLRTNFFKIYHELLEKVKEKRDYLQFSKLLESFATSPNKIKDTDRLFLPPPQSELLQNEAKLKIYLNVEDWEINSVAKVQSLLATMANNLPIRTLPIRVDEITKGSLIEILTGELLPVTTFFYLLYKFGIKGVISDSVDLYLKFQTVGQKKLENEERRLKIKELEAKSLIQNKSDKLSLQKLENEVKKQELDIIEKYLQLKKFSVENYSNTLEGKRVIDAITELNSEYEILDLKLLLPEKIEVS
jgi:uncharacterized protein YjbI with pentapeptide repeats